MAKIKVVSRPSKRGSGDVPLYIRITHQNVARYLSLEMHVPAKHWNARAGEVRKTHKDHVRINKHLTGQLEKAQDALLQLQTSGTIFTPDRIKDEVEKALGRQPVGEQPDYITYAREILQGFEDRGQIGSHIRLTAIVNKLEEYHKKKYRTRPLRFEDLTPAYLRQYMNYLVSHHKNKPNTVAKNMKGIRAILYQAIREGHMEQAANPFFQIKLADAPSTKTRLSREQVETLQGLDLEPGTGLWHTRNYFFFSMYLAGVRFGDLARMKWKNEDRSGKEHRLRYMMTKTQRVRPVLREVLLIEPAREILALYRPARPKPDDFIFPILTGYDLSTERKELKAISSQTALSNTYLKQLQAMAGIQTPLTTHVALHTFTDLARKKGWDLYAISKARGHTRISTTEKYLASFDQELVDEKMRELF